MRTIITYRPWLKVLAMQTRNNFSGSEIRLWEYIKDKQLSGCDFQRQKPIDKYNVDFYCSELMLAIELNRTPQDHREAGVNEIVKEERLKQLGITVMHFKSEDVMNNIDRVLNEIIAKIRELQVRN